MSDHEQTAEPVRVKSSRQILVPRRILMYHKRPGEISVRKKSSWHLTVFNNLPRLRQGRWDSINSLDLETTGLLLCTNDRVFAKNLSSFSVGIEREYWVQVAGEVSKETLQVLRNGIELEDGFARFDDILPLHTLNEGDQYNSCFNVVLKKERNREAYRLWKAVGCQVIRLKCVRFDNLWLPEELTAGSFRSLTIDETNALLDLLQHKRRDAKTGL